MAAFVVPTAGARGPVHAMVCGDMPGPHPIVDIIERLRAAEVFGPEKVGARPLSGGVSCEIWVLEAGDRRIVVKQALPKLRVKDEWYADVGRNAIEQDYIRYIAGFRPDAVPRIIHADPQFGFFAMEYLGEGFQNWKDNLLAGNLDAATASRAGSLLGEIHRRSWGDEALRTRFDTGRNFHQLRTEPYLLTTGQRHPRLREIFEAEAGRMESARLCLVHGDYSPKNILVQADRVVLLDCEVAWFGEPAFDVAFLLNHLHIKALRDPARGDMFLQLVTAAWDAYRAALGEDLLADMDARVARQLLMQMLARVDGKSPVEYLTDEAKKNTIRGFVTEHLPGGLWRRGIMVISDAWRQSIHGGKLGI